LVPAPDTQAVATGGAAFLQQRLLQRSINRGKVRVEAVLTAFAVHFLGSFFPSATSKSRLFRK